MPTTLVLAFPWGRYHATPWGRHVNEGAVEVPPSPWRLLRALYSVWRTRVPELDEAVVHPLLQRLAVPPVFDVPRHGVSHTRHYYPDSQAGTDRTLDAFAVFEREAQLAVTWPVELEPQQRAALIRLAEAIPYFGRADSICVGSVPASWQPLAHERWVPVDVAEAVPTDAEVTAVLAPELPLQLDTLLARPVDVRRGGLLFPAGSRFVGYQRCSTAVRPAPRRTVSASRPTALRYTVLQAGLPPETDALIYTDLLRQAALSKLGGLREERDRTLLGGKAPDGQKLRGHGHAHFLPVVDERRLTELVIWVPDGLPGDELKAAAAVSRLWSPYDESRRLRVGLAGVGPAQQIVGDLGGPSRLWRSVTPFTPARYPKRHADWQAFVASEVARELASRGLPAPRAVRPVDGDWRAYARYRPSRRPARGNDQGRATRPSCFIELAFDEPVGGPLALGHLSHFGLGLLAPLAR